MNYSKFVLSGTLLFTSVFACSASDSEPARNSRVHAGAGGKSSNGGSGGTSGVSFGSTGGDSSTTGGSTASGGSGGSFGTGGSESSGGSGGAASGSGGAGGEPVSVSCTPGSGTENVGTSSILDKKTCLVWQKAKSEGTMTNKAAAKYCNELAQDGFDDWRIPTSEELASWPNLAEDGLGFVNGPTYIRTASTRTEQEQCVDDAHSCNIAKYNSGPPTCYWQGTAFTGRVVCVRGQAAAASLDMSYSAAQCTACASHVSGEFKIANCVQYVQ